jgi:hypothetical protein
MKGSPIESGRRPSREFPLSAPPCHSDRTSVEAYANVMRTSWVARLRSDAQHSRVSGFVVAGVVLGERLVG